ncbi:hypothetical protein Dda_3836 [Drechslerella dactyloides]|uniref:SP-RING-type domain-containing protein n=1 Tax=Drechslerella dactyloides TaxID=74499 RepID=A0AAD6J064_DREDA|nr:hypothetical protein Dda_3836 [Drechslerella dactyloides]
MPVRVGRPSLNHRRRKVERPPHAPAVLPIHDTCASELRAFHAKYPPANLPRLLKEAIEALRDVSKDFALNRKEIIYEQGLERDEADEAQVAELGKVVEKNIRKLVDLDAEVQMKKSVLQEISNAGRDGGDGVQPVEEYIRRTAKARRAYMRKDLKERYATVADYIDYRTVVHAVSDPTAPVPQRKDWFKKPLFKCDATAEITDEEPPSDSEEDGDATAGPATRRRDVEMSDAEDSDDEIEETSATRNLKCPLTMRRFEEPVKAGCQHSFEREALATMLKEYKRQKKAPVCPMPGCGKEIKISELREDVVMKSLVEAEIRKEQMRKEREMSSDDEDEEEAPARSKGKGKAVASRQSMRAEEELPYGGGGGGESDDEDMEDGDEEEDGEEEDEEEEEEDDEDDE